MSKPDSVKIIQLFQLEGDIKMRLFACGDDCKIYYYEKFEGKDTEWFEYKDD